MKVKDYGYRSGRWTNFTDDKFRTLSSRCVLGILDRKDEIIESLKEPTTKFSLDELGDISSVSVRERGLVFEVYSEGFDDSEPDEYATVYFFQNGEIYYVPEVLSSVDWTYSRRDDDVNELEERMGYKYELAKGKNRITGLFERTKQKNERLMELVKNKIATILDQAKEQGAEFDSNEMVYMKMLDREARRLKQKKEKEILTREEAIKLQELTETVNEYIYCTEEVLPEGFEWCRKAKYSVQIELGCYKIDEEHPLLEGFVEKNFEIDGKLEKYAVKEGENILEQNHWVTNPDRPYIITGTAGERWPVKPSNLSAYDVDEKDITIEPKEFFTKNPDDQEFLVAKRVPRYRTLTVISKWAYRKDGTIDESQVLEANSKDSKINHDYGDYVVAKHIEGKPEYMELPEEERNTLEAATIYSPRIINGRVMEKTYDHALTKVEIKHKYKSKTLKLER